MRGDQQNYQPARQRNRSFRPLSARRAVKPENEFTVKKEQSQSGQVNVAVGGGRDYQGREQGCQEKAEAGKNFFPEQPIY